MTRSGQPPPGSDSDADSEGAGLRGTTSNREAAANPTTSPGLRLVASTCGFQLATDGPNLRVRFNLKLGSTGNLKLKGAYCPPRDYPNLKWEVEASRCSILSSR